METGLLQEDTIPLDKIELGFETGGKKFHS